MKSVAIATLLPHFFSPFWQSVAVTFPIRIIDLQRFLRKIATLSTLFLLLYFFFKKRKKRVAYRFGNFGPKCGNFGEKTLQVFDSKE